MYFVGSPRHGRSLKDTLNKDVPEQEPRRYLGRARAIVNEALIWHAAPTQKQTSALHVDNAQESLIALHESADALANPHLKSAVSSVSALWQTAKVEQCAGFYKGVCFTNFVACGTVEEGSASLVAALTQSTRNLGRSSRTRSVQYTACHA